MSKDNGFILLHRSILDNRTIWDTGEPFSKRDAWIDLLLLAQHSEYKGLERGQCGMSKLWFAHRWKWSRNKVSNYLDTLMKQGMVTIASTTHGTTITIVNYDKFQNLRATDGTTKGTTKRATKKATDRTHTKNVYTSNADTINADTKEEPAPLWDPQGRIYE